MKIVLYIATSKDGYIADEKGSVNWLPQSESETGGNDYGYQEFYDSVDALAIGRKTYEQVLGFGDWPYSGKPSYVFTHATKKSSNKDIEFVADDIPKFIRKLEDQKINKLWMVGGSELIDSFYTQGRIDEFIVTKFPVILKKGISLNLQRGELIKLPAIKFDNDVIQEHYRLNLE